VNNQWAFPSTKITLENDWVKITPVNLDQDLKSLFSAVSIQTNAEDLFEYHVNIPPIDSIAVFETYLQTKLSLPTEVMYKIFSKRLKKIVGCVSLMNIRTDHGAIEVGSIWYSKVAQKTEINTNVMILLFSYVFEELKYRRLEWKCNNNNLDSKRAALRLGFEYEGLFRQHMMSRGKNRDTAWFSMIDSEWFDKKKNLESKLVKNFKAQE
jgi:RimJ/RimL family protein N-acetyltransferase